MNNLYRGGPSVKPAIEKYRSFVNIYSFLKRTDSAVALRRLAEVERDDYGQISMYAVYAIYNPIKKVIYIGQTKDLPERLRIHNEKLINGYTSRFEGHWILIYSETQPDRLSALKREKQLKSFRGREFIKSKIPR